MNYENLSNVELRSMNHEVDFAGRRDCAQIGALWYWIEKRNSWFEWGYASFADAITEEGPRSYSTIVDTILNYKFFVVDSGFSEEEYRDIIIKNGVKKATLIRREDKVNISPVETITVDNVPAPVVVNQTPEKKKERVAKVAETMEQLSVEEGRALVRETAKKNGVVVRQSVARRYSFTPEQDKLIQEAICHIKKRTLGNPVLMSDSTALAYVAAEYLSANGTRAIMGQ